MLGEYKNSEVILRPTVTFRAPKVLNIPGTLMIMIGKMECDNNEVKLTYHIKVHTPELEPRNYRITATHSLDFTRVWNDWKVEARADTNRSRGARFEPEVCHFYHGAAVLEDALKESAEWIGKMITEFALYNTTEEDMNFHLLDNQDQ